MVKWKADHAVGFKHIDGHQKDIVDGVIKKKVLRDVEISRINRGRKKSTKSFW